MNRYFLRKAKSGEFKLDLVVKSLLPDWKLLFSASGLKSDLWAGLMVAGAAGPLSLAIAMGSKVEPGVGLVSAIIAGIICALFGGSRLSISGPANSMLVLIALIV
jgi:carbonic anhydrase